MRRARKLDDLATTAARTFETGTRGSLAARAALLLLLLFCEKFLLSFLVDYDAVMVATGLQAAVRLLQHVFFHFAVSCTVALAVLVYARGDAVGWASINDAARGRRVRWSLLGLHSAMVLPLVPLTYYLYGRSGASLPFWAMAVLWIVFAGAAVMALIIALAPWRLWLQATCKPGLLWVYAAAIAAVAVVGMDWSQRLWDSTAAVTFDAVWHVLVPFIPSLQADAHTLMLSSSSFAVRVEPFCSGLEGMGLLLVFCGAWLACFHQEYYFPRALLLLPVAVGLSFALNVLRIAALMLIGYAGFPNVAIYGFHSQAGWIAFNCAAALIAVGSRRNRWLSRVAAEQGAHSAQVVTYPATHPGLHGNPTEAYLLPLLGMLAAGMLARAISGGFETLYVLRPLCGLTALLWYRKTLGALDWRCSWRGPALGVLVFVTWLVGGTLLSRPIGAPAALSGMSTLARFVWIGIRVVSTVTIAPIAEELAFRGYLLRRLNAPDFESVRFSDVGLASLIVSSVAFGLEKGTFWLPGLIAGLTYALILKRRGRFGEAVVAHVTASTLLTSYALISGQWQLW